MPNASQNDAVGPGLVETLSGQRSGSAAIQFQIDKAQNMAAKKEP